MPSKPTKIKRKKSIVLQPKQVETTDTGAATPKPASNPVKRKIVKKPAASGKIPSRKTEVRKPSSELTPKSTSYVEETEEVEIPLDPSTLPVGKPVSMSQAPASANPLDPSGKEHAPVKPPREVVGEPTFKFFCYRCGQKLMVPVSWANKSYPCGRCHHEIVIPPPLIGNIW